MATLADMLRTLTPEQMGMFRRLVGMDSDLKATGGYGDLPAGTTTYFTPQFPDFSGLSRQLQEYGLRNQEIPPSVAAYMTRTPSYAEGQAYAPRYQPAYPYAGQNSGETIAPPMGQGPENWFPRQRGDWLSIPQLMVNRLRERGA